MAQVIDSSIKSKIVYTFSTIIIPPIIGLFSYYLGTWIFYNEPFGFFPSLIIGMGSTFLIGLFLIFRNFPKFSFKIIMLNLGIIVLMLLIFFALFLFEASVLKLTNTFAMITREEFIWQGCEGELSSFDFQGEITSKKEAFEYSKSLNEWRDKICKSVHYKNFLKPNARWIASVSNSGKNWKVKLEHVSIPYYKCTIIFDRSGKLINEIQPCFYNPKK